MTTLIESASDYPRPPRIEPVEERIRVVVDGVTVADSVRAVRILETNLAPAIYLPAVDVRMDLLGPGRGHSVCEWKGDADYHTLSLGDRRIENVAWSYPAPRPGFESIADHLAFYAGRVDEAWVGDEQATGQGGGFYGGWITSRVRGPFKGDDDFPGW
jgi:uncharacterized protein (DUF427 family)